MIPKIVVITAPWAGGKTVLSSAFAHTLRQQNTPFRFISDRTHFEQGALIDAQHPDGPVCSIINKTGQRGTIQFIITDGFIPHQARRDICQQISNHIDQGEGTLIVELAIGPNVILKEGSPFATFNQTTKDFVSLLTSNHSLPLDQELLFLQLQSSLETRMKRQAQREGTDMPDPKAFTRFAGRGGELNPNLTSTLKNHGWTVITIDNETSSLSAITKNLGLSPIDPETAFQIYRQQLLSEQALILPQDEIFQGHPERLQSKQERY